MSSREDPALNIAVFIDLENLAIGVRDSGYGPFDVQIVFRRLLDKGKILVRRAYASWSSFEPEKRSLHAAGVELIDLPGSAVSGKNSADIKMVVDALEVAYTRPHIDAFALVTGDSDFYPLVAKLRENNKYTLGVGVKGSTSKLLIDACDEFVLYDDLARAPRRRRPALATPLPERARDAFEYLIEAAQALQRENRDLHSSLVKETIKRKQPQFNEEYHGYASFNRLLEDAARHNLIKIRRDERSGTYVISEILAE
jgi:hypothetical protein